MQLAPRFLPEGQSGRGVELTTRLCLVPRLRTCGNTCTPLHPTYTFTAGTENTYLPVYLTVSAFAPESLSLVTRKSRSCWPMFWQWFEFGCWQYNSEKKLNELGQHFPWSDTHIRQSRNQEVALTNAEFNTVLTLKVHWMLIYMV